MNAGKLGVSNVKVSSFASAGSGMSSIQKAIEKVSTQRSKLGALQNRLEHTVANLDNIAENTQTAESRIRDTDMAEEMVNYSKNNILAQAGQSMLAQANQSTRGRIIFTSVILKVIKKERNRKRFLSFYGKTIEKNMFEKIFQNYDFVLLFHAHCAQFLFVLLHVRDNILLFT